MSDLGDLTTGNFPCQNFFADFHELKDVDSKNKKKCLNQKNFLGLKMPKNAILRLNISKTGKHFDVRFFPDARGQYGLHSDQV